MPDEATRLLSSTHADLQQWCLCATCPGRGGAACTKGSAAATCVRMKIQMPINHLRHATCRREVGSVPRIANHAVDASQQPELIRHTWEQDCPVPCSSAGGKDTSAKLSHSMYCWAVMVSQGTMAYIGSADSGLTAQHRCSRQDSKGWRHAFGFVCVCMGSVSVGGRRWEEDTREE